MNSVAWASLPGTRIYFGHQSVGQNIIDGMRILCAQADVPVRWVEHDGLSLFDGPVFAHTRLGKNRDPISKIDTFAERMRAGIGHSAEIALFKLCYVDVTAATEVGPLFSYYARVMAELKSEYPRTVFAHVTMPFTVAPRRWRRWIGRLRGQAVDGIDDNGARARFNNAMRRTYAGHEPVFDLAAWETQGGCEHPKFDRDPYSGCALDPRLSSDGGHLSPKGQVLIGGALLDFLSALRSL